MTDLPKPPSAAFRQHLDDNTIGGGGTNGTTNGMMNGANGSGSLQQKVFHDIVTSNSQDSADSNGVVPTQHTLPLGVPSDDDDDDDDNNHDIVEEDLEDGTTSGGGRKSTDQFHSLPSADELKLSVAASRSRSNSRSSTIDGDVDGTGDDGGDIVDVDFDIDVDDDDVGTGKDDENVQHGNCCVQICGANYVWVTVVFIFVAVLAFVLGLSLGLTKDQRAANSSSASTFHGGEDRFNYMVNYLSVHGVSSTEELLDSEGRSPQFQAVDWLAHDDELEIGIPASGNDLDSNAGYDFVVRYAMAVLYYATAGKSWHYDLDFISSKPTCQWFRTFAPPIGQVGVLCDETTETIVGLSLVGNNVVGSLPSELGKLTTLTYIESISNTVTGSIPAEFEQLTKLRTLVLTFNMLTGTIPAYINKWKDLEFLYLSNNMLTGTIPDTLTELTGMSVLALDDNNLSGGIESVWFTLSQLEFLYLEDNDFSGPGLPGTISQIAPALNQLDLSNNRLTGSLPADLFRLTQLEILDLHSNKFSGGLPSDVNVGDLLRFLALHDNQLAGRIPATMSNLQRLSHLDLSTNLLTGPIPLEMELLSDLTFLFLGANNFTKGVIPTWIYEHENLRELSLKSTRRTGEISELIGRLDQLVLLDLDDNELAGQIPESIGLLTNLQYLLLNRNDLSSAVPPELGSLEALKLLLLDRNSLTGDLGAVCNIESLEVAYVDCGAVSCSEECCSCCTEGQPCHEFDLIPSTDPNWESNYTRQFFAFTNDLPFFSATDDEVVAPP